ncbi:MAG: glycosyltransferase family 4 protein [Candidatus Levyibacteriota bacterium]
MRIGLFTESYLPDPNGVATSIAASAKELRKLGHTVYVIAPKHPGYKDEKNVIRLQSMRIYEKLDMRFALHLPERNLIKILRLDLDIVHGHDGGPVSFLGWEVAHLKNLPYIGTYHTLAHEYTHYVLRGKIITPAMVKIFTRIFGNMCEKLITPTEASMKELRKLGVKTPVVILPNGIDRSLFQKSPKGFLRRKLKIKNETKILLYVGRLGREKSVGFLLKSFQYILKNNPNTALVLVGDGPEKKALKELVQKLRLSNVYFTGFLSPEIIPQAYADAHIFVFSSKTETQGMVLIEAMATGLPVVAVKDRAFSTLIQNGHNGYLSEGNEKEFAKLTEKILTSPALYAKMCENAITSTQKYALEDRTRELLTLYTEIIKKHKSRKTSPMRKTIHGARRIIKLLSE